MIRRTFLGLAASLALAACGGGSESSSEGGVRISGARATFPAPLYAKWAEIQKAKTGWRSTISRSARAAASSRSPPRLGS